MAVAAEEEGGGTMQLTHRAKRWRARSTRSEPIINNEIAHGDSTWAECLCSRAVIGLSEVNDVLFEFENDSCMVDNRCSLFWCH